MADPAAQVEILDCNNNPTGFLASIAYQGYAQFIVDTVNKLDEPPGQPPPPTESAP